MITARVYVMYGTFVCACIWLPSERESPLAKYENHFALHPTDPYGNMGSYRSLNEPKSAEAAISPPTSYGIVAEYVQVRSLHLIRVLLFFDYVAGGHELTWLPSKAMAAIDTIVTFS